MILRLPLITGCSILYYADDTLLSVRGLSFREAMTRVELGVTICVTAIERLDLRKTKIAAFGRRYVSLRVGGSHGDRRELSGTCLE